jgi:adenylate cyclase
MLDRFGMHRVAIAAGAIAVAALLAGILLSPLAWRELLRENGYDLALAADQWLAPQSQRQGEPGVIVVDIDRRSLEALGPWPWPRATTASLLEAVAAAKPAVVALDILFAEADSRSPAALARQVGAMSSRADLLKLADELPDGDKRLAEAGKRVPLVLGFVLDPQGASALFLPPVIMRGAPPLEGLWSAPGAVGPLLLLMETASGIGALSLPANVDGVVRHVPYLVEVDSNIAPGLALETIRLAHSAATYFLQADPSLLAIGDLKIHFPRDGLLRLLPTALNRRAVRTISALDIVRGNVDVARLAGALVVIGGSAPELGGLRATASDPLTPSAQIQADAIEQMLSGRFPRPLVVATPGQDLLLCGFGILAAAAGAALPPLLGALSVMGILALTWIASIAGLHFADRLIDPLSPTLVTAIVFLGVSVASFAAAHRREMLVRRRFEQHLAPEVVRRIVREPGLLKLSGERREVTALFTDAEGFTAMTHRADPEELVSVLDAYFEGIATIVVDHGGMVDKIVGDAIHALFNAPLDLAGHPQKAVECAIAINAWTESYRAMPRPLAIGFGRTRIGIETGQAIVGDVGLRSKLDYTAYGDAVNAAARFEAANKELGSAICVGPATAARCDSAILRPLGAIFVRGRDEALSVFEPWPTGAAVKWREQYLAAFAVAGADPRRAAELFDELAAERREDVVVKAMSKRLHDQAGQP